MKSRLFERLSREIDAIPIADAHEHIMERRESLTREVDLFDRTYVKGDFVSAGMPVDDWVREGFDPEEDVPGCTALTARV